MDRALLVTYEPALFLLAALGWAGWELWSVRTKRADRVAKPADELPPPRDPPARPEA